MNLKKFFEEAKKEVLKISWINKKELLMTTISVFFVVGLFAIFFLITDLVISNLITYILGILG